MGFSRLTADYSFGESATAYWTSAVFTCNSFPVEFNAGVWKNSGWVKGCPSGYQGSAEATMAYPGPQIVLAYCKKT